MCADGGSKCRPLLRPAMISISKRSSPPKKLRGVPDLRLLLVKSLEPFEPLLEPVASLLLSAPPGAHGRLRLEYVHVLPRTGHRRVSTYREGFGVVWIEAAAIGAHHRRDPCPGTLRSPVRIPAGAALECPALNVSFFGESGPFRGARGDLETETPRPVWVSQSQRVASPEFALKGDWNRD